MPYALLRHLLFLLPPETAHAASLNSLSLLEKLGLLHLLLPAPVYDKPVSVAGLQFPNPVGLAAGLDKNAEYIDVLAALGFGFIEVGTITPRPQPGNPRPRLFRIPQVQAIINRMGFNNKGLDYLLEQVQQRQTKVPLGINLGKNFDTPLENAVDDYLKGLYAAYQWADYVTINISSPNTPGLRELQHGEALNEMLEKLKNAQYSLNAEQGRYVPLFLKIAPDLAEEEVIDITQTLLSHEIDGLIATNTTNSRPGLDKYATAKETGGLSGTPLLNAANHVLATAAQASNGKLPIIAVGGIMNAQQAQDKLKAGASLVQIYTGLIYQGPKLVQDIIKSL
ncbi:quinone-dependent dihydroorotate dehydrogenase [Candidatus Venteria ishoeyi]|uniref:Dihydroorotate dehydrogenase (quinone) n=1 Tax=Candidatus Venteria ishoeyi TaxID=1899563 RepID=A0A1H6F6P3_9GAMM|nr:quinone-dependent dihydroorotate dehydrogenase [Candidatus Venteria ishoeyi]SEH05807.1 Dihydroorotate dehydrogenase (quinone) [Candidatus Venteria ishoeyi]